MGLNWIKIGGFLKPIAPLMTGPLGRILQAVSVAVSAVEELAGSTSGEEKRRRAIYLTGSFLDIAEDAAGRDLVRDVRVADAVGAVIDAEVALRNAYAAIVAVVDDVHAKQAA